MIIDDLIWKTRRFITRRGMPNEMRAVLNKIHKKYAELDLSGNYWPQQKDEKLSKLIDIINNDTDISRLVSMQNSLPLPFDNSVYELVTGEKTGIGGFGVDLCIEENGLYVNDFDSYESKASRIPASAEVIKKYNPRVDAERIRGAVVDYTEEERYIDRLTWLKQMHGTARRYLGKRALFSV